ncbi:NADH-cytochrome b5 reductase 1 [Exophiala viscosa]|uniref:NADH-cytochrome b5 reductase 1 n=1 Tax=Exophiala viscosa TaxID=2486360 RepID=UPI0021975500|nr:NADH-cytochrome b5 reductase 1 [Exophiala viscosa]
MNRSLNIEAQGLLPTKPDNTYFYPWLLFVVVAFYYWINHESWHSHPAKSTPVPPITPTHPATSLKPRPILDPDNLQDYPLLSKWDISHNVTVFRLGLPQPTDVLGLPSGQHIALAFTDPETGKVVARSYTPISTDDDRGYFDVLVKLYPDGLMSKHLQALQVGDLVKARGPKGAMVYKPGMCERIGMIAGGSGVTPMLQIIKAVLAQRPTDTTQIDLIYANRTFDDIVLKDVLDEMAEKDPGFKVHYVLSQAPENWTGSIGHVTKAMIKERLPPAQAGTKIMLCGPAGMQDSMKIYLEELGFDKARLVPKRDDQVFCF